MPRCSGDGCQISPLDSSSRSSCLQCSPATGPDGIVSKPLPPSPPLPAPEKRSGGFPAGTHLVLWQRFPAALASKPATASLRAGSGSSSHTETQSQPWLENPPRVRESGPGPPGGVASSGLEVQVITLRAACLYRSPGHGHPLGDCRGGALTSPRTGVQKRELLGPSGVESAQGTGQPCRDKGNPKG